MRIRMVHTCSQEREEEIGKCGFSLNPRMFNFFKKCSKSIMVNVSIKYRCCVHWYLLYFYSHLLCVCTISVFKIKLGGTNTEQNH